MRRLALAWGCAAALVLVAVLSVIATIAVVAPPRKPADERAAPGPPAGYSSRPGNELLALLPEDKDFPAGFTVGRASDDSLAFYRKGTSGDNYGDSFDRDECAPFFLDVNVFNGNVPVLSEGGAVVRGIVLDRNSEATQGVQLSISRLPQERYVATLQSAAPSCQEFSSHSSYPGSDHSVDVSLVVAGNDQTPGARLLRVRTTEDTEDPSVQGSWRYAVLFSYAIVSGILVTGVARVVGDGPAEQAAARKLLDPLFADTVRRAKDRV